MTEEQIQQQIADLWKAVEGIKNNPNMPDHFHDGNDVSRVSLYNLDHKAFGHMYSNADTTITVSASDTWYEITSNMSGGEVSATKFSSHFLKAGLNGQYMIAFSAGIETATADQEIAATVMINGVANEAARARSTVVTISKSSSVSGLLIANITAGDEVSVAIKNYTAATNIVVEHAQLVIVKL